MAVEFWDGSVLFGPGGVAMDENCCCTVVPCCSCSLCKHVPCCVTVGIPPIDPSSLNAYIPGICDNEQWGHDFEGLWWLQCGSAPAPASISKGYSPTKQKMPQVFVPPFTKAKYTGKSAPNTRNFSADNFIPQTFQNSAFPGGGPFSTIGETGGGCCGYGGGMQRLKLNPATGLPETTGISCFCNGKNEEGVIFPCFPGSIYAYYCYALGPDGLGDTVLALFAIVDIYCGDMATTFPGGFSRFYSFPMVYTDYESCSLPVVNVWYYDDWQSSSQPPMAGISWNNIPTYSLTVNPIYGTIASCVPIPFIAGAEA